MGIITNCQWVNSMKHAPVLKGCSTNLTSEVQFIHQQGYYSAFKNSSTMPCVDHEELYKEITLMMSSGSSQSRLLTASTNGGLK